MNTWTKQLRTLRELSLCLVAGAMVALGACGSDQSEQPSTGDPEADRRADLRVGADEDGKRSGGKAAASGTLFERIGGYPTIERLVDDMTERVIADPRVNFERRNVKRTWYGAKVDDWEPTPDNVARFKKHMVDFLALAAGGPVEYTGRDMAAVHKGMRITNSEFDAMVGDIKISLDRLGLGTREKRDLIAVIETTRREVVERQ